MNSNLRATITVLSALVAGTLIIIGVVTGGLSVESGLAIFSSFIAGLFIKPPGGTS